jgi:23S rRNA G2069 N7-methylase RlmK/C1962 C5-methylase RlmI
MQWVYRVDIARGAEGLGAVVRVVRPAGKFIGQGSGRPARPSRWPDDAADEKVDTAFFKARMEAAMERRRAALPGRRRLPGRHASGLLPGSSWKGRDGGTVQSSAEGMAAREAEARAAPGRGLAPRLIALANTSAREFEHLPRESGWPRGRAPVAVGVPRGANRFGST